MPDRPLTVDERRQALYAEINRQAEELRVLDTIRDRILALDPDTHDKVEKLRREKEAYEEGKPKSAKRAGLVAEKIEALIGDARPDNEQIRFRIRKSDEIFDSEVSRKWRLRAAELKEANASFGDYLRGFERFEEETMQAFEEPLLADYRQAYYLDSLYPQSISPQEFTRSTWARIRPVLRSRIPTTGTFFVQPCLFLYFLLSCLFFSVPPI